MLINNPAETAITLRGFIANLIQWLNNPSLPKIYNDDEVALLYSETLKNIEEDNLLDTDSCLYSSLKIINDGLTSGLLQINVDEFCSLLDALSSYATGEHMKESVQQMVRYLPATLADKHATILHMEAQLLTPSSNHHNANETIIQPQDSTEPLAISAYEQTACSTNQVMANCNSDIHHLPIPDIAIPLPLQMAMHSEVAALRDLLSETNSTPDTEALRDTVESHLDNLTFIAESIGINDFAEALKSKFSSVLVTNCETGLFNRNMLGELLNLLDDLLNADTTPDATLTVAHATPSTSNTSLATDTTVFTDERLGMLHEELSYFDEQLDSYAAFITSEESSSEIMFAYINKYSELIERLIKACDALGLQGLKSIGIFVIKNINLLPTIHTVDRTQLRPLLLRWPQMVKQYLADPTDDPTLMELIELMQHRLWPACFDGLDSRDLYAELSNGAKCDNHEDNEIRPDRVTADDVSLVISNEINPQLRDAYLLESPDVAAQFNQVISNLATSTNPLEVMRAAQRLSHTLKGSANLVGIRGIANLAHHVEDILDIMSRKGIPPSTSVIGLLQEAADCLEGMLDAVAGIGNAPSDSANVLQRVIDVANRLYNNTFDSSEDIPLQDSGTTTPSDILDTASPATHTNPSSENATDTIRVPTTTIDAIFRLVEEITISLAQIQERFNHTKIHNDLLNKHDRNLQLRRFDLENLVDVRSMASMQKRLRRGVHTDDRFDPLELDQYDKLHGATHSYIEAVADARQISNTIHKDLMSIDRLMTRHSRLNKELQHLVSKSRMVPVSNISSRLQRTVRQAARATGKAVNLTFNHHNLLMDSDVLNKLIEPLSHILRNAVDHGISETAEGTESGHITVTFGQEGNSMVIRCSDDGKGLDYVRIREVALERGMLSSEQPSSRDVLAQLIMLPAFTTRRTATHVSGRGIGLDAVLTSITELKGSVTVGDLKPHGTEFVIRLPLSLVTTHTLVVQSGGVNYAIPTSALSRILPAKRGEIIEENGSYSLHFNGETYSLRTLSSLVEHDTSIPSANNPMLLTTHGTTPTAIAVDLLQDSFELVIKRLGRIAPRVPGIVGVSVLSDGQLVPVLDIPGLLSGAANQSSASLYPRENIERSTSRSSVSKRHVLVVDDSLSARNSLAHLLEDGGYSVLSARDGTEAVEILQRTKPLAVLADMEMPRMDGIELTRHIRANKELYELPVVMITSRSQKKHRDVAHAAGVSAYVTKPFVDNELIDLVSRLVSQQ